MVSSSVKPSPISTSHGRGAFGGPPSFSSATGVSTGLSEGESSTLVGTPLVSHSLNTTTTVTAVPPVVSTCVFTMGMSSTSETIGDPYYSMVSVSVLVAVHAIVESSKG